MKYKTFLFTREYNVDYCWHIRPEVLPGAITQYTSRFFELRDRLTDRNDIVWERTIFFFKCDAMVMACRILETGTDYVGRPIYSFEGIVSKNRGLTSVMAIPDVVNYYYTHPGSFSALEKTGQLLKELTIDEEINPLLPYENIVSSGAKISKYRGFHNFLRALSQRKENYSCVIAPGADKIHPYLAGFSRINGKGFENHYNFDTEQDTKGEDIDMWPYMGISLNDLKEDIVQPHGDTMKLFLVLKNEFGGAITYQWILTSDADSKCIMSEKRRFKHGIPFSRLVSEARKIKVYYALIGYNVI